LTFSLLLLAAVAAAAFADEVEPDASVAGVFAVADPLAVVVDVPPDGWRALPLNGGIDWMNIAVVFGFEGAVLTAVSDKLVGFEEAATFCVVVEAPTLFVDVLAGASGRRFKPSGFILDGGI
jgi:hypothetical protein